MTSLNIHEIHEKYTSSKWTNKQEIGYANKNANLGFTNLHFEISQLGSFM